MLSITQSQLFLNFDVLKNPTCQGLQKQHYDVIKVEKNKISIVYKKLFPSPLQIRILVFQLLT